MFKKVDIDRLSSDKKYLGSLRYRSEIQIFWALSVFATGLWLSLPYFSGLCFPASPTMHSDRL